MLSHLVVSEVCVCTCVCVHMEMVETNKPCMCASGQWKVKFELKPQKGLFSKLDGDLIKVPVLYQKNYMMPLTYIAGLKAQVTNAHHLLILSSLVH